MKITLALRSSQGNLMLPGFLGTLYMTQMLWVALSCSETLHGNLTYKEDYHKILLYHFQ
jgi:hypothetical protein